MTKLEQVSKEVCQKSILKVFPKKFSTDGVAIIVSTKLG
jgi:hypothetical protein